MTTDRMLAAVLHDIGQTPSYEPFPAPTATADDVVIEVTAAALKPSDRLAAAGVHYAPQRLPHVVGLDGVGRLADGTRVAFLIPQPPYGGMAEQTLVRHGAWLPVPPGADDITVAAVANPGVAAWKALVWEGGLTPGQSVLVLGATGASGRIAVELARRQGARVVAAGRNAEVLERLLARGADATVRVDRPADQLAPAIAAQGPYDLIVDYLWGAPAEATFAALSHPTARAAQTRLPVRYIQVGMTAGPVAALPAITLRAAPVQLSGSGAGGRASLNDAAQALADLLDLVATGEIHVDIEPVPLADVERVWSAPISDRRVVLVP